VLLTAGRPCLLRCTTGLYAKFRKTGASFHTQSHAQNTMALGLVMVVDTGMTHGCGQALPLTLTLLLIPTVSCGGSPSGPSTPQPGPGAAWPPLPTPVARWLNGDIPILEPRAFALFQATVIQTDSSYANEHTPDVAWTSSNPDVATVSPYGAVRAFSPATTTICRDVHRPRVLFARVGPDGRDSLCCGRSGGAHQQPESGIDGGRSTTGSAVSHPYFFSVEP